MINFVHVKYGKIYNRFICFSTGKGLRGYFMKRTFLFLSALLAAQIAGAQQLYVSNIEIKFDDVTPAPFCDTTAGTDVDFICDESGGACDSDGEDPWTYSSRIEFERAKASYPGACLALCATISCVRPDTTVAFGIDDLTFEIFKFSPGANPLDPASTPPIRTISLYNIGNCDGLAESQTIGTYCSAWDGMYNLNGQFGKTNGQYGFRARVKTNQVSATAGNISIEQTSAFPGENQVPIQVDVTNIHMVRSSPTVVGKITGVAAQPYNIMYRLSKDATTTIKIFEADQGGGGFSLIRTLVDRKPRVGEGSPDGTLTNGDFWDGRNEYGELMPAGLYLLQIEAESQDMWGGTDLAWPATVQIGLDPLQITDMAIKPLGPSVTDVAIISYMLTESATVYVDIYPPETYFADVNSFRPQGYIGGVPVSPLVTIKEQKDSRKTLQTYWDGRDSGGNPVCDGNYVYSISAELVSGDNVIQTTKAQIGAIPVARGQVLAFISPSSTVIGSTPSVAGLDPFYFRYKPRRDTIVTANIRDMNNNIVRTLVNRETRFANFTNTETWDGKDESGNYVSSGTYLMEVVTEDSFVCSEQKISTITVLFPVNMFRITDVKTAPLLGGTSAMASLSFNLSQTMWIDFKIYDPVYVSVAAQDWPWESGNYANSDYIVYSLDGIRPGRYKVTEFWDGRDENGIMMPDGTYPFTLVAHSTTGANAMYATDKVYGYINIAQGQILINNFEIIPSIPQMYNSSDTLKLPPYEIAYSLSRQSSVTVQITNLNIPPAVVANIVNGGIRDGDIIYKEYWDGKDDDGNYVASGPYNVRIVAQDITSSLIQASTVQTTIDVEPLKIYDIAIVPLTLENDAMIIYQISEPMKMAVKIYEPGTDAGQSMSQDPPGKLVKRIIGVRPSRTQIVEYWDGTDLSLSRVPDGNYVFKIYGSTDMSAIDSVTGNVEDEYLLADDVVVANIPVTKGGTEDLCVDFSGNTFFAPNPYEGLSGYFQIYAPITGDISLKIYNLAGEMVYENAFEDVAGDTYVLNKKFHWAKTNSAGKKVARGVYFAVLRFEASEGTRDMCQVVKKILIP